MKDLIEKKLDEHARRVVEKENLTMDDINFLIYRLNHIEMKENAAATKAEKEASDRMWKERMSTMIETLGGANV